MKIAHIVRRFTFSEWGGTESVVWNIALQQKSQGLTPEILCTAALDRIGCEIVNGITIRRFPYVYPYFPMPEKDRTALDKKGGNPFSPELLRYLKHGNFDIFHLHAGGRIAQYSIRLGKKLQTPCIMSLHGGACAIPEQEMALMLKPLKHKFSYGGILDRIFNVRQAPESRADLLLALSKEEKAKLEVRYPGKRVELFPNGILHRELPDAGMFRKKSFQFRKLCFPFFVQNFLFCFSRFNSEICKFLRGFPVHSGVCFHNFPNRFFKGCLFNGPKDLVFHFFLGNPP